MSRKFRPGKGPPIPSGPCPHGFASEDCCMMCRPLPPSSPSRAAWRDDEAFLEQADLIWPADFLRGSSKGYDGGASQRMTYRYQGWLAAMQKLASASFDKKLEDARQEAKKR